MKHTPGPWKIDGGLSKYSANIDIYSSDIWIGSAHGDHVPPGRKPSSHPDFPSNQEAEANATLIASAPELLEALRDLVLYGPVVMQNLMRGPETKGLKISREVFGGCLEKGQTAIAKATTQNP